MYINGPIFIFAFVFSVWAQQVSVPSPSVPMPVFSLEAVARAETILQDAIEAYEKMHDYTAVFLKQERIGKRLRKEEMVEFKFQKPFRVFMKWIKSPDEGMEVIYKEGENQNRIYAHLGGFLNHFVPSVNLDIHNSLATRGNRHLITETGIGAFLTRYQNDFQKGKERQEMRIILHGEEQVLGRKVLTVEAILPESAQQHYYCYRSLVYFDIENKLPIKMEFYDFKNRLIERYGYNNLKINPGLKELDFDPNNETYNF